MFWYGKITESHPVHGYDTSFQQGVGGSSVCRFQVFMAAVKCVGVEGQQTLKPETQAIGRHLLWVDTTLAQDTTAYVLFHGKP